MLSGVILAGGGHRETNGEHRAFLAWGGQTLLERQIREMRACCSDITIVANDPKPFLRAVDRDIRIIADYYEGKGVLGGMHAGLALARHRQAWVIGCHMPFPSAAAARLLLTQKREGIDAVLPWVGSKAHPLHGIYDQSCADTLAALLDGGNDRISGLLHKLEWFGLGEAAFQEQGIDCRFVQTIDSTADYERLPRQSEKTC